MNNQDITPRGTCTNCGLQLFEYKAVCPNCGAGILQNPNQTWPPAASGYPPQVPWSEYRLITGNAIADVALGIAAFAASVAAFGLGVLIMPILYFLLRDTYKAFTRGIGIGIVIGVVLLLGAIVTCFAQLNGQGH